MIPTGVQDLLAGPERCRVFRNPDADDFTCGMMNDKEGIEGFEGEGFYCQEITSPNVFGLAFQELFPARGGCAFVRAAHVFFHATRTPRGGTLNPSLSNSPSIRIWPHKGLSLAICRINWRSCNGMGLRPDLLRHQINLQ